MGCAGGNDGPGAQRRDGEHHDRVAGGPGYRRIPPTRQSSQGRGRGSGPADRDRGGGCGPIDLWTKAGRAGFALRLLILAPQWPDPPCQGAAIRNLHIAEYLAGKHEVSLLTFVPEGGAVSHERLGGLRRAEVLRRPTRTRSERLRTLL